MCDRHHHRAEGLVQVRNNFVLTTVPYDEPRQSSPAGRACVGTWSRWCGVFRRQPCMFSLDHGCSAAARTCWTGLVGQCWTTRSYSRHGRRVKAGFSLPRSSRRSTAPDDENTATGTRLPPPTSRARPRIWGPAAITPSSRHRLLGPAHVCRPGDLLRRHVRKQDEPKGQGTDLLESKNGLSPLRSKDGRLCPRIMPISNEYYWDPNDRREIVVGPPDREIRCRLMHKRLSVTEGCTARGVARRIEPICNPVARIH